MTDDLRCGPAFREHWTWRPDWRSDRPCLWWYLTFGNQREVVGLGRRLGAALDGCGTVDVVPARWLHLTLREVGYVDEVSADEVDAAARTAQERLADLPAFELQLGPPAGLPGAVVMEARPAGLVDELRACLPGIGPRPESDEQGPSPTVMKPHVSVAYVNRDCPGSVIMDHVPAHVPPVRAQVETVALAAVTRHRRRYQWTVRHRVPLGRPRDRTPTSTVSDAGLG